MEDKSMTNNKFIHLNNFVFELKNSDFQSITRIILNEEFSKNSSKRNRQSLLILKWIIKNSLSIKYVK